MKNRFSFTLSLALITLPIAVFAHDPSLHKKAGSAAPDCAQMKDMDLSAMDVNDPVAQALHEKCAHSTHPPAMDMKGMDMKRGS